MTIAEEFAKKEGIFACDPQTVHHFSDGLYAKQMVIPAGYEACQHAHNYSHLSVLASGRVIVMTDDWKKEFKAPACIEIKAGVYHKIISLEDATWFCVHATEETDAEKIDEVLIARG
jgi:mannose-6-phosphate isomerase-like protein (cupin superfamily)